MHDLEWLRVAGKILPVASLCPRLIPSQPHVLPLHGPESVCTHNYFSAKLWGEGQDSSQALLPFPCMPGLQLRTSPFVVAQGSLQISKARLPGNPGSLPVCWPLFPASPHVALVGLSSVTWAGHAESWGWCGLVLISFKNLLLTLSLPLAKFNG